MLILYLLLFTNLGIIDMTCVSLSFLFYEFVMHPLFDKLIISKICSRS